MDRRLILAGLAGVLAAPALAQTSPGGSGTMQGTMSSGAGMAAGAMGEAEMNYVRRIMAAGTMALETSRIALQKANNPEVKGFAQFEVTEQETIAEVLRSMQEPGSTASTAQAPAGGAQAQMDEKGRAMVQKLQQASAGAAFDREYVQGQIQGHQELMQIQEEYIRSGRNREIMNVAKLARAMITEHLVLLQNAQKALGRG